MFTDVVFARRAFFSNHPGTTLPWASLEVTDMVILLPEYMRGFEGDVVMVVADGTGSPARNTSAVFTGDTGWAAPAGTSATHTLYVPAFVVFTVDVHSPDPFVVQASVSFTIPA
ncbi:hypothetical protein FQW28_23765, partial [Salmonella enterica]|nr:hypothetical protein [Salmonella enterica]